MESVLEGGFMRVILLLIGFIAFVTLVFAGDLEDFQKEKETLLQRLQQHRQTIGAIQIRIVELNALIQYIESKKVGKSEK